MRIFSTYRRPLILLPLAAALAMLLSCSTKKNTFTRRLYHNITSHYNVYFNGRESLKEGLTDLQKKVKDDYSHVLPVYNYGIKTEAQGLNQQWDRTIQKASMTIQKHSMVFGGVEKVRWIDDSYMLIGRAYFYKQEYISARRTFNFIIREYGDNDIKYDAMLWLARTYNQTGEFEKAEPLLNLVTKDVSDGLAPYDIDRELPQVYANHYILQQKYDEAVSYLYEAIAFNPERDLKTRMMYILGQIFQQSGDLNRATGLYANVIKRNPPYEMAFQSKINLAKSFDANTDDPRAITKLLEKMLRDDKNKDFKDQIYYALSEVALKEDDTLQATEYLALSVQTSSVNSAQKATSALKLANIYFILPQYQLAQAYYDTTMIFLPKDYPDYQEISSRTKLLSELVGHLVTIQVQDSLQQLAMMPQADRDRIINQKIKDYFEEQKRLQEERRLEEQLRQQEMASAKGGPTTPGLPGVGSGKWYFYNESTKSYGFSEFARKWGRRKLEDLWRLSNKQVTTFATETLEEESDTAVVDSLKLAEEDPTKKEYYLKDLPLTEEAIAASNEKIEKAYFEMGKIYLDRLDDLEEAKNAFETLEKRFPENEYKLQVYYSLYKIYTALGDNTTGDYYKNLVLTLYPDSDYAQIIMDPNYYAKLEEEKNKAAKVYEETYKLFEMEQYYLVIAKTDLAMATYGDTIDLAPKFEYLRAVSIGKVDILDSLVSNLKRIVTKYPNSEVKNLAQSLLVRIARDNPEFADETLMTPEAEPEKESPYKYNPSAQHLFLIVVDSKQVRLNPLKVKISDFNMKNYSLENLVVNSLVLDNEHYLVTVGNFKNASRAIDYLNNITLSDYVYADLVSDTYQNFIISTENYATFFKQKDIEEYNKFFEKNYPKQQ